MNDTYLKNCSKCSRDLPSDAFYSRYSFCKECKKKKDASRKRGPGPGCNNHTEVARAKKRRWNLKNRERMAFKNAARRTTREAIDSGRLVRPSCCEKCGNEAKRVDGLNAIQAHHTDYSKPLDVQWLCPKCHTDLHRSEDLARKGAKT